MIKIENKIDLTNDDDTYDFTKIWTAMNGGKLDFTKMDFGSFANDLGTITSKMDAINPYDIDIYLTIRR